MGIILATTGSELMSGDKHNVISDFEGTAMLAPLYNLVPDPRFQDYDEATGALRYWLLGYPPKPDGWIPYVRDTNIEKHFSSQSTGPLSMDESTYEIADELVPGASPPDAKDRVAIASPIKPKVKAYRVSKQVGLPAGWYCLAMGYIAGPIKSNRLTGPGPRSDAFELAQGQGLQMEALTEMPEGVGAVVYYLTKPQTTEDAAYSASLYEQKRYDIKGLPRFWNFYGPLSTRKKWNGKNHSFVGATEDTADLQVSKGSSRLGGSSSSTSSSSPSTANRTSSGGGGKSSDKRSEDVSVSYRYVTESGTGQSSEPVHIQDIQNTGKGQGGGVVTVKPKSFPEGATGYKPEVTTKDKRTGATSTYDVQKTGPTPDSRKSSSASSSPASQGTSNSYVNVNQQANSQSYKNGKPVGEGGKITQTSNVGTADTAGAFGTDEAAPIYGGQPEDIPAGSGTEMTETAGTSTTDETGVERPTDITAMPTILDLDTSGLTPGKHYTSTSLMVGEDEGPPSAITTTNLKMGEGLRIHRPTWHDRLDNSDLAEKWIEAVWEADLAIDIGEFYIPRNPNGYKYRVHSIASDPFTGPTEPTWGSSTDITHNGIRYIREGSDRTGKPRGWDLKDIQSKTTILNAIRGVLQVDDRVSNTTDDDLFVTPMAELNSEDDRYTMDLRFLYDDHTEGATDLFLEEYNDAGVLLASQFFERLGSNVKRSKKDDTNNRQPVQRSIRMSKRTEDTAGPKVKKLNPSTTNVAIRAKGKRDRKTGKRNMKSLLSDFHASAGWGIPRIVDLLKDLAQRSKPAPRPDKVPDTTYQNFSRPHGGYCVVVDDPNDAPKNPITLIDENEFIDGVLAGWQKNIASTITYLNEVKEAAAIFTKYGLQLAKIADGTGVNNVRKAVDPTNQLTAAWDMYIDNFSTHDVELGSIRDELGATLAKLTLKGNGDVEVRHNATHVQTVPLGIDNGNMVHFQLAVDQVDGIVKLIFGTDEENSDTAVELTGIDFAAWGNAVEVFIGQTANTAIDNLARFNFMIGKIRLANKPKDTVAVSGNYIEYYGPARTPLNGGYGPTGMKIPARGNQAYTLGVNVWYEDLSPNSELFILRAMDDQGRVLQTYDALVKMSGDKRSWNRHNKTITTPPNTAYLEFYQNKLGAGVLRIHGIQVEEGTIAHPFSYLLQRSGWFSTFLRTRQTAIEKGDPAFELSRTTGLRNVFAAVLDTDVVSTLVRFRSANTFPELDAQPYSNDFSTVDPDKEIFEVRLDLASTVDGETPEVRAIELDVGRAHSQLLKPDGTEYSGGTIATEITTPSTPRNLENVDLATGQRITQEWGMHRMTSIKFELQAFRRSDIEQIIGQNMHILETPLGRFVLGLNEIPEFTPEPSSRVEFLDGREYFQRETASFDCYVISREDYV